MERSRNPLSKEHKLQVDKIVGQNIRTTRKLMRLTRGELAELMDLTVSHIGLIERGHRGATTVTLSKLATIFNIHVDNFFQESSKLHSYTPANTNESISKQKISALIPLLDEDGANVVLLMIQGIVRLEFNRNRNSD